MPYLCSNNHMGQSSMESTSKPSQKQAHQLAESKMLGETVRWGHRRLQKAQSCAYPLDAPSPQCPAQLAAHIEGRPLQWLVSAVRGRNGGSRGVGSSTAACALGIVYGSYIHIHARKMAYAH